MTDPDSWIAEPLGVAWVIGSNTQVVWHEEGFEQHLHDGTVA